MPNHDIVKSHQINREGPGGHPRFLQIMSALVLIELFSSLEANMIMAAIPTIAREFGSYTKAGWLLTGFLLVQAAAAAVVARIGDIFGRGVLIRWVVLICGLGSLCSAVATSDEFIIMGRAVQGLSGALLPLCFGIAREITPVARRTFWVSCLSGVYTVSAALGIAVGGALAQGGDWRAIFHLTVAFAIVVLAVSIWVLPTDRRKPKAPLDVFGGLLFIPGIVLLLFAFDQLNKPGWSWMVCAALMAGGAAILATWFVYELRHRYPLIDVRLLFHPRVAIGNACFGLYAIGMMQGSVLLIALLQQPISTGIGLGLGAAAAGLLKLPANAAGLVSSPLGGWISTNYGNHVPVLLSGALATLAWLSLFAFHDAVWQIVLGSMIGTFATVMLTGAIPNIVLDEVPADRSSEATALSVVIKGIFAAIGTQAMTYLLSRGMVTDPVGGSRYPSAEAYKLCMAAIMICAILVIVAGIALSPKRRMTVRPK